MAKISDIIAIMNRIAPENNVMKGEYDNVGLIVGRHEGETERVLCCLDVTGEVLNEAVKVGAKMIISHHPMIWSPIKSVTDGDVLGSKILYAAENGLSVYAAHTNLDFVTGGINDFVAELFGLTEVEPLLPDATESGGFGRVGNLPSKTTVSDLRTEAELKLKDKHVSVIGDTNKTVTRVAVINGAGGGDTEYIDSAIKAGATCLITAEVKHHVAVYAKDIGFNVIEAQHYTMEHCYLTRLVQLLKTEAHLAHVDVEFLQSVNDINPRF